MFLTALMSRADADSRNAINFSDNNKGDISMSVKKILMLTAAAGFALTSTAVLAGGPDYVAHITGLHEGAYIGGNLTYVTGSPVYGNTTAEVSEAVTGFAYGAQGGYDVMINPDWSFGGNAFFSLSNAHVDQHKINGTADVAINWYGGIGVEPSYNLAPNVRLFAKLAWVAMEVKANNDQQNLNGYSVGVGTEVAVHGNLGIRTEYSRMGFDKGTFNSVTVKPNFNAFTVGLDWHFV